jgi:cell division protease FtsH
MDTLHRLAAALLEREILDAAEIDTVIRGEQLPPAERRKNGQPGMPETGEKKSAKAAPAGDRSAGA